MNKEMDTLTHSLAAIDSRLQQADYSTEEDELQQISQQLPTENDLERMQLQLAQLQTMSPSEEVVGRFETNLNAAKAAVAEHKKQLADKQANISQKQTLDLRFERLKEQLNAIFAKPARFEDECRQDIELLKVSQSKNHVCIN